MLGATTAQLAGLLNDRVAAAVQIDTIRKVTPDGVVTTLAGTAGLSGSADGLGAAARFISPSAVTVDSADNVYILDTGTIRKITPEGNTTTIAGMAGVTEIVLGATPRFASPSGLAVIGNEIVISDTNATWVALLGAIASHLVQHANTFVGGRPEQVCWQGLFMNRYEHRKNELARAGRVHAPVALACASRTDECLRASHVEAAASAWGADRRSQSRPVKRLARVPRGTARSLLTWAGAAPSERHLGVQR